MEHLRILGLNMFAVLFSSVQGINPYLQTISLILAILYTITQFINNGRN